MKKIENTNPQLVYTRKYGWIVAVPLNIPVGSKPRGLTDYGASAWAYSRPGKVRVMERDVLATRSLPPPPKAAL
jgi:hypothetical protein